MQRRMTFVFSTHDEMINAVNEQTAMNEARTDLHEWLGRMHERAADGWVPIHFELSFGLRMAGADPQWTYLLIGVLIISAVAVDQWIRKLAV